jgi:hypothetical protein
MFTHKKNFILTGLVLISILLLFLPISLTQGGLVPNACSKQPSLDNCNLCTLLELVKNIINFLIYTVAPALVGIFVAYGGIMLLISGGSEEKVQSGKDAIFKAITGYLIVLGSWVIINTILNTFSTIPGISVPC